MGIPTAAGPSSVNYNAEMVLVDFSGGAILPPGRDKDLLEPRSILLSDAAGNLTIRDELDDQADYERFIPPPAAGTGTRPKPGATTAPRHGRKSQDAPGDRAPRRRPPTGVETDMMDRGGTTKKGKG